MNSEDKKMKVAFVLGALNRGGTESLILDICRCANRTPFEVVCIYRKEGNLSEEFHKTNARLIHIPRLGSIVGYMWKLRKVIQKERITIVHSQTPSNTAVLGLSLFGCKTKLLTTIHGFSFLNSNKLYQHFVFGISTAILFVSNYQKKLYIQRCSKQQRKKCYVVYNGIDTTKYGTEYEIPKFYKDLDNTLKLCVVGNIRSARTYDVILKAIYYLRKDGLNNVGLYIIGNTPIEEQYLLDYYRKLCKEYEINDVVHFVGSRSDVPAILQSSDIYIMSSIETFGISVVESIMSKVPVIVNDFNVMQEITENGKLATLYKTGDSYDLAEKIKYVVNNFEYYRAKAFDDSEYVKEKYSIENCISQLNKIYIYGASRGSENDNH